ncbi:MAG: hypothetical protein ACRDRL_02425 [Sciscionella sp.]
MIDIAASGICHTDFDIMAGRYPLARFPLVPDCESRPLLSSSSDRLGRGHLRCHQRRICTIVLDTMSGRDAISGVSPCD